jgi:MinD-like ATPase involved in chromosome partitioning or flagellar assembly
MNGIGARYVTAGRNRDTDHNQDEARSASEEPDGSIASASAVSPEPTPATSAALENDTEPGDGSASEPLSQQPPSAGLPDESAEAVWRVEPAANPNRELNGSSLHRPDTSDDVAAEPTAQAETEPPSLASAAGSVPAGLAWSGYDTGYAADHLLPVSRARARRGWRSVLGLRASAQEQHDQDRRAAMCANFGRPIWIVVANPRGSSGKTPLSLGLAGAFGLARGSGSLAFEAHELRGTMAWRTEANGTERNLRDFVNAAPDLMPEQIRQADVARYARHQVRGQFDAMVSPRTKEDQLSGGEFGQLQHVLGRFYPVIVVDTANNEDHSLFQAALDRATVLVVPVKWRPTSVLPAVQMLESEQKNPAHRNLVQNAVVVASNGPGDVDDSCRAQFEPLFRHRARAVVEVPTDPHVHADGVILHDQLRPATRRAYDAAGAAAAEVASSMINGSHTNPDERTNP